VAGFVFLSLSPALDINGNILEFDQDGDILAGGAKIKEAFFFNFSRLLSKDEIKKSHESKPVDKEKKAEGKVIAIGDGEKIQKLGLKKGDKVLFGKYAGEEVKVDEVEYKILSEEDVLAVIE